MILILLAYPLRMIDLTAIRPHHGREGVRKGRQKVEFTVGVLGTLSVGHGVLCMKFEGRPGGSELFYRIYGINFGCQTRLEYYVIPLPWVHN